MNRIIKKFNKNVNKINEKSDKDDNALVLGLSAEMLSVVMALIMFVMSDILGFKYMRILSVIWIFIAFLKIYLLEEVIENNNRNMLDALFVSNIISFVFVEGFWITPILSLVVVMYLKGFKL